MVEETEKKEKASRVNDALALLERLRQNVSYKKLEGGKLLALGILILDAVIFGYFFKNRLFLMAFFVSGIMLLIGMFALQKYFFPDGDPAKINQDDSAPVGATAQTEDNNPLSMLPSSDEYSKNVMHGMFGDTDNLNSNKTDPYGLDKIYKV